MIGFEPRLDAAERLLDRVLDVGDCSPSEIAACDRAGIALAAVSSVDFHHGHWYTVGRAHDLALRGELGL